MKAAENDDLVFIKTLLAAVMPMMIFAFFVFLWLCYYIFFNRNWAFTSAGITLTFTLLSFVVHPAIMQFTFAMFNCTDIEGK
jgi:ATP/ADP translocase